MEQYEYALQSLKEIPYDRWREYDPEDTIRRLRELPGIGDWTAHYIAMRAMNWPDAFPHTDLGIRKALKEHRAKRVLEIAESWRPWRSYAVMHLWKSLEN